MAPLAPLAGFAGRSRPSGTAGAPLFLKDAVREAMSLRERNRRRGIGQPPLGSSIDAAISWLTLTSSCFMIDHDRITSSLKRITMKTTLVWIWGSAARLSCMAFGQAFLRDRCAVLEIVTKGIFDGTYISPK